MLCRCDKIACDKGETDTPGKVKMGRREKVKRKLNFKIEFDNGVLGKTTGLGLDAACGEAGATLVGRAAAVFPFSSFAKLESLFPIYRCAQSGMNDLVSQKERP